METTVKFLVLLFTCGVFASSMAETKEDVDVKLVRHHEDHRIRRDAGESSMPDVIVTKFVLSGDDVVLRLRRVPYLPMVVVGVGIEQDDKVPERSAVYKDPSRSASFIVARSALDDFLLDGNLKHQGKQLLVKPSTRSRRSAQGGNPHEIVEAEPANVGSDAIFVPAKSLPIFSAARMATTGPAVHTIETVFVIDHSDFVNWQARYPADSMSKLKEFYTYGAETLNTIYTSVKDKNSDLDIRVIVTQLYVLATADETFTDEMKAAAGSFLIDGRALLDRIVDWIPQQSDLDQKRDHYMLFTDYELGSSSGGVAAGIAFVGQVCQAKSVSTSRNLFGLSTFLIAAHELGHCLNSLHDGDLGCRNEDLHVMAPVSASAPIDTTQVNPGNVFDFSQCSVDAFAQYLSSSTCTLPSETTAADALPPLPSGSMVTDRDEQCRLLMGDVNSEYCPWRNESEVCHGMLCKLEDGYCLWYLPVDDTPCGTEKVCQQGLCVPRPTTTTTPNTSAPGTTTPPTSPTTTSTTRAPTTTTTTTSTPAPTTTTPTTTTTPPTTTTTTPAAKTTAKGSECLGRLAGSTDCSTPLYHAMCLHCWLWKGYRGGDCLVCFPEFGLIP